MHHHQVHLAQAPPMLNLELGSDQRKLAAAAETLDATVGASSGVA